jgi:hypothetical protein
MQYVGDLRRYLATSLQLSPSVIRMICMGKELARDDFRFGTLHVLDLGCRPAKLAVQMVLGKDNPLLDLPEDVMGCVMRTAPDVVMAADDVLWAMLMYLLDFPSASHALHCKAYQVLRRLKTNDKLVSELRRAMSSGPPSPGAGLPESVHELFYIPISERSFQPQPGALLYTLEALYCLLEPALSSSDDNGTGHLA